MVVTMMNFSQEKLLSNSYQVEIHIATNKYLNYCYQWVSLFCNISKMRMYIPMCSFPFLEFGDQIQRLSGYSHIVPLVLLKFHEV